MSNKINEFVFKEIVNNTNKSPAMAETVSGIRSSIRTRRIAAGLHNDFCQRIFHPDESKLETIIQWFKDDGWQMPAASSYFLLFTKGMENEVPTATAHIDVEGHRYIFFGFGEQSEIRKACDEVSKHLPKPKKTYEVFSLTSSGITSNTYQLDDLRANIAHNEFYPWLDEGGYTGIDEFVDDFLKSKETILILAGEPGTGKTTLLTEIIDKCNTSIGVTFDTKLMATSPSEMLNKVNDGSIDVMIFEDADILIGNKRSDGKEKAAAISSLLNTSNGLIPNPNNRIKLIFTTNLIDSASIDPALLREGRLFASVLFKKYNAEQARKVAKVIDSKMPIEDDRTYSLAQIANYNEKRIDTKFDKSGQEAKTFTFGFI